jgi:hypothetical protein
MVGLRAKVLGRIGWTTSPYLRAGALSCPSLAVYRAGVLRGSGRYTALWPRLCDLSGAALRIRARNRSLARRVYTSEAPEWVSNSLWPLPRLLSGRAGAPILRRGLRFAPSRPPKPRRITRLEIVDRSTIVHAQEAAIPSRWWPHLCGVPGQSGRGYAGFRPYRYSGADRSACNAARVGLTPSDHAGGFLVRGGCTPDTGIGVLWAFYRRRSRPLSLPPPIGQGGYAGLQARPRTSQNSFSVNYAATYDATGRISIRRGAYAVSNRLNDCQKEKHPGTLLRVIHRTYKDSGSRFTGFRSP